MQEKYANAELQTLYEAAAIATNNYLRLYQGRVGKEINNVSNNPKAGAYREGQLRILNAKIESINNQIARDKAYAAELETMRRQLSEAKETMNTTVNAFLEAGGSTRVLPQTYLANLE